MGLTSERTTQPMKNLAPIFDFLKTSRAQFIAAADEIPDQNWLQSPAPNVWSPAEVVAHVGMVEETIIHRCQKVLGSEPRAIAPWRKIHPPLALATWRRKKVASPIPLDPSRVCSREKAYTALDATRAASLSFMKSLGDRDLRRYRFPHPIFGSLGVYEWYRFIGYHELRHRKQIRELVEIFHR